MGACSEQQRVACALGGIYTALAIDKVLPVLHCGPGCQGNIRWMQWWSKCLSLSGNYFTLY